MYAEDSYLEQFCEDCHDETDQRVSPGTTAATCLRCGSPNAIRSEDDRVEALMQRVREEDAASLGRLRASAVPQL
jgi:hypothetical protein